MEHNLATPSPENIKRGVKGYNRADLLREYEVSLRFLSRGVLIRVGCREIAFEDIDKAMIALEEYVKNPYETVQKWQKLFNEEQ